MAEYIDREAALEELSDSFTMSMALSIDECKGMRLAREIDRELIKRIPAADAIEELQQIAAHYEQTAKDYWKEACDYKAMIPRWISVTEEPPLKVGDDGYNGYLVYADGYCAIADYTTDKGDNVPCFYVDGEYEPGVTHYMPLPEPPKEET